MKKRSFVKTFLILITISLLLFSSCNRNQQTPTPQQQSQQTEDPSEKVPDQLKEIENSIENIIKTLKGPAIAANEGKKEENAPNQEGQEDKNKEENKGNEEDKGKNSEDKGAGQEGNKGGGEEEKKPAPMVSKPQDPWTEINSITNNLHYQWNNYMPMAVKKGAGRKLIDDFSDKLNGLTNTIISKNALNTLTASNSLYGFIPDFFALYRTKTSSEIKRVRYYTRSAILNAKKANWTQVDSDMNNLKPSWALYKTTLDKKQQDNSNKLDFSISELDKVIKERNQALIEIKGNVAMSNIDSLEKAQEEGGES
ncbi:MAG: hypothetical protein N2645_10190 [Clostridia bacterium]|nr:hypothetical protein [Clostridia bacterium]